MNKCPVCSSDIPKPDDITEEDLIECLNCGTLLEIISVFPFKISMYEEPEK